MMGRKNPDARRNKPSGYKGVEYNDELQKDNAVTMTRTEAAKLQKGEEDSKPSSKFSIVGKVRLSKTRESLAMKIRDNGKARFFTLLVSDVHDMIADKSNSTVALVREYEAPDDEDKNLIIRKQ